MGNKTDADVVPAGASDLATPPLPNHSATHTILSEIQDELREGKVLTAEFVAWCEAKFTEAKSYL